MSSIAFRSGSSERSWITASLLVATASATSARPSVASVRPTTVDRIARAAVVLGERFHLGRDLRRRPVAVDRAAGIGSDADRNRNEREAVELFAAIGNFDVALLDVFC